MSRLQRRLVAHRPTTMAGKVLLFAAGLVVAAAGAAFAYLLVTVAYGGGNYSLAQASTLSAPTAATVTEASATSVSIGWTNPGTQVTGAKYKVTQSPGTVVVCHTVSGPTCTATGLSPATTYSFSVVATSGTNWHSTAATKSFKTLGVTTTSLPNGSLGVSYSTTLTAVGGTGAYTWSLASGTLPSWATLTPSTGTISGTPTAAGTTTGLKFKVSDSKGYSVTSGTLSLSVNKAATSFTIKVTGGSTKTITFGAQATLSESGLPATGTGTLTFKSASTVSLCSVALTVATHCKTLATLAAGTYVVHATYAGTTNYNGSTSTNTVMLTVTKAAKTSSISLATISSPKTFGTEGQTFTGTVTGAATDGNPSTGTVTVKTAGGTTLCTTTTLTASGTHAATYSCVQSTGSKLAASGTAYVLHANYTGGNSSNTNYTYNGSTSGTQNLTVNKAAKTSSISLATISSPKTFGTEGQTFTGTVTGAATDGNPSTGTVTVKTAGGTTLCTTTTLTASGTHAATYSCVQSTGSKLAASGTAYVLHANYTGGNSSNTNYTYNGSTSGTQNLTVNKAATSFTIKVTGGSTKTITFGAQATLSESGLPATGTGTLTFKSASTVSLCSVALTVATHCKTLATLAAGTYVLHATYAGTTNYNGSTSTNTVMLTVTKAAKTSSISLATISSPKTFGTEGQTFTGTVTGAATDGNPSTGTVTVKTAGGTTLCTTTTLTASGTHAATYSCVQSTGSKLAASGTAYVLHANYTGGNSSNTNYTYNGSTSGTQNLTVNKAAKTSSISLATISSPKTFGTEGQTFTGTVTGAATDGNPSTGTVTVKTAGGTTLCTTTTLTASGTHAATYSCVQSTGSKLAASGTAYVLHANYTGGNSSNTNYTYNGSTSGTQNLTVNKAAKTSSISLATISSPKTFGTEGQTFTGTVTGAATDGNPSTGTVTVKTAGGTTLCTTTTLTASGTHAATYSCVQSTGSKLAASGTAYVLHANYTGGNSSNTNYTYNGSTSGTQNLTVNKAAKTSSISLATISSPKTFGTEGQTFTGTVTGAATDGNPSTGTVTVKTAGGTTLCTTTTLTASGTHAATYSCVQSTGSKLAASGTAYVLHANYTGGNSSNTNYTYNGSTSGTQNLTVNKAAKTSSISLATISSPKTFGTEGQTFTGTVTGAATDGNPSTGTVTVKTAGGTTLCTTTTLTASGTHAATYSCVQSTGSKLAASGTAYVLHANYTGGNSSNTNYTYNGSTSGTQNLTVNKAAKTSSISLATISSPKTFGTEGQTFTGTVTGAATDGNPSTGTVTVKTAGGTTLCTTTTLTASGTHAATYSCVQSTGSKLAASGTAYVLHANYTGGNSSNTNYTYNGSTSGTQNLTVNKAAKTSSISLATISSPKTFGTEGQTFTGTVTGAATDGNPSTGTVTVKTAGGTTLCTTTTLTASGTHAATYSCVQSTGSKLAASGTAYVLHANYTGGNSSNTNYTYNGSTSGTQNLTVNKAAKTSSISLATISSPKTFGTEGQTFTGTVTGAATDGNPSTGTVTVKTAGGTTLCTTTTLTASGTHAATYSCVQSTGSKLAASGTAYVLHANYTGGNSSNTNYTYNGSTSGTQNLTVNKAAKTSSISLATISSPKTFGTEGQTFTGTVTGAATDGNPSTGTVTVKTAGGTTLCTTTTLTASGTHAATYSCVQSTGSKLAASGTAYVLHANYTGGNSSNTNYTYNASTSSTQNLTINPANGLGTMTVSPTSTTAASTTNTLVFTYTVGAGGLSSGKVSVTVPTGWTAPTSTNTTRSAGTLATTGQVITVTGLTLSAGTTLTITYGVSGHTVTAQSTPGIATFTAKEAYSSGTLSALSSSPKVTVAKTLACSGSAQTVTLAAHSSVAFTAVGGGGGAGAKGKTTGGSGAAGASVTGSLTNNNTTSKTLTLSVGCAGVTGTTAGVAGGVSHFAAGGTGGTGMTMTAGGGSGGGATSIVVTSTLVEESGGGGGGGGGGMVVGSAASVNTGTTTSTTAKTGGTGTAHAGMNGGGGGGGGGAGTTASGGAAGAGGTGGLSYTHATTVHGVAITVSSPVSGANPAAAGSIKFTGGLPVITSGSSTTFAKSVAGTFTFTATGAPSPTISNTAFTGCTPSTLPGTLTFTGGTGSATVSGTPTATATYTLCITATNTVGTATQKFTLTVSASVTGTVTTWTTSGVHTAKSVKYPATAVTGDLLFLIVAGNQEPGPAAHPITGWHTGDLGASNGAKQIHGNLFWRVDAGGTAVTVTPFTSGNSAAWIVAFNPGGTPTIATATSCHTNGKCTYATTGSTLTPTMVATTANSATEYSIVMVPAANTLTLTTANGFTIVANEKVSYGSSQGDAFAIASKSVPTSGTTPTAPVWKQSGTAKQWAWVTTAFT